MDAGSMSRSRAGRQAGLCLLAPAPASVEYVSSMGQTAETGAADSLALNQNRDSISFVVTAREGLDHAAPNLAAFRSKLHDDDEVIVITGCEPAGAATPATGSWFSVVTLPGASAFALRAHVPAVCRKEWVIVLEDHAVIGPRTIDAVRELIRANPELDLIAFLAKNLTSVSPWGWANFLYNFTPVWAPLDGAPAFAVVTSAIVRRAKLGGEKPLEEGAWELQVIPGIFSRGGTASSNDIFFDHVKHLNFASALTIAFHNARAGAALQRKLGIPIRNIVYEGWYCAGPRPRLLAEAASHRMDEFPARSFGRVRLMGCAHLIGNIVGSFFGGGRSGHKI